MHFNKTARMTALAGLGLFTAISQANAASNPTSTEFSTTCTTPTCNALGATFDGKLEWYSGAVLLFTESGTFSRDSAGRITAVLTGNGSNAVFKATYADPMMTIFNAPDLSFKLFSTSGGDTLLQNQTYRPVTMALWSKYSEDAQAEVVRALAAEDTLNTALNIEISKRANGDKTFQMQLDAEIAARLLGDNTLTTGLNNERTRALAAEQLLTTNLNNEISRATTAENTERARAIAEEQRLDAYITTEKMRLDDRISEVDTRLDTKINIERDRALLAEQVEFDRATAEEMRLDSKIDAREQVTKDYADSQDALRLQEAKDYADQRYSSKSCPNGRVMYGIDADGNPLCTAPLAGRVRIRQIAGEGTCTYQASCSVGFQPCSCSCQPGGWWGNSACTCTCTSTTAAACSANSCTAPAQPAACPDVGGVQGQSELAWCQLGTWDNGQGCLGTAGQVAMGPQVSCSQTQSADCSCSCAGGGWWGTSPCTCSCTPGGSVSCTSNQGSASVSTAVAFCAQAE